MNISLIAPRMSLRPMDSELKRRMSPSLALLTLAALTGDEHSVQLLDENIAPLRFTDTPDLAGITVNVDTSARAYEIAAVYRAKGVPVVLGGIHVSANPGEASEHCDAVCIGEGEYLWPRIIDDAYSGRMKKIYRSNTPVDAADIPVPRHDILQKGKYLYTNILCSSRGCPHRCGFCYNSAPYIHRSYRNRPVETVCDEIRALGTRHVMFIDDNFIGNIPRAAEMVRALRPMGLTWNAAVSADVVRHPSLLDDMAESGCRSLFIGLESLNSDSLEGARKHQNRRESYENLVQALHARGIMLNASICFGFDHDTPAVFDDTVAWLTEHRVETMTAHILTPYPGTEFFAALHREGRIIDYNWRRYNTAHAVFRPKLMSPEELEEGYLRAYRNFYSFINIVWRMPERRDLRMPYILFNFGYRKFGRLTSAIAGRRFTGALGNAARRLSYGIE